MSRRDQMHKGSSELLILTLPTERPTYGYEIAQALADYRGDEGTCPPALVAGNTLWAAAGQRLAWEWGMLLAMVMCLATMAAVVHGKDRPLPLLALPVQWTSQSLGQLGQKE